MRSFEMLDNGELSGKGWNCNKCLGLCGDIAPMSFPELALFTEMVEPSEKAIKRACQAEVNESAKYKERMAAFLTDPDYKNQPEKIAWKSVWMACCVSGSNPMGRSKDFENGTCESTRDRKKGDYIFEFQDFYTIQPSKGVLMQLYGQQGFADLSVLREQQRKERRARMFARSIK
jgi:hypothetical protein